MGGKNSLYTGSIAKNANASAIRWFVASSSVVLCTTGFAKVWTVYGNTNLLGVSDPLLGLKFWQLMLVVGWGEIAVALVCAFSKKLMLVMGLIAWLATNFVVYRLGLWWIGWHKPCSCMGNLSDALHLKPEVADNLMKVILAYLLLGSYGLLIWQWRLRSDGTQGNLVNEQSNF
jgi:hypothetical protein